MARGAVQADHLLPVDLSVAGRHADREAVRIVAAWWIRHESETLDVLEKWLIGDASIRIRDLLLERQQPCDRVGFAAFTQMVVLLSFLGGQTIAPERRGRIVQALRQIFGNGPYRPTQCGSKHE